MTDFGKGLYLVPTEIAEEHDKHNWDIDVDETGDLRMTETGEEELKKDVALTTGVALQDSLGEPISPQTANEITALVQSVLKQDSRIDRIQNISIDSPDRKDTLLVKAVVDAEDDEQELVFEVTR